MFKGLRSGMRRSSGGSSSGDGRISGLHGLRGSSTEVSRRRRPAYLPDTAEEHGFDSNSSRLSGLEK